jgi:predicted ATPase
LLTGLLGRAPGAKLLVTSRQRLSAAGEWLLEVAGLEYPREEVPDVDRYAAVRLFRHAASRASPRFALAGDEAPAVARVCRAVEGMPLAIELAAGWTRSLSCREIATEMTRNPALLTNHGRTGSHDLQALFADSWGLLSTEEQTAFRRLCVCVGGFERDASTAIADASPTLLAGLIDKSFLRREPSGRYETHELVRHYGLARLAAVPHDERSARDRHARHYLALLRDRGDDMGGPQHPGAVAAIRQDLANVRAAWTWAVEQRMLRELGESSGSLLLYLELLSRWKEGGELFGWAVETLEAAEASAGEDRELQAVLGSALAHLAWCRHRLGDGDRAIAGFRRAAELLGSFAPPRMLVNPLYFTGVGLWLLGDSRHGETLLRASVSAAKETGSVWYASLASSVHGLVMLGLGQTEQANACFSEGLQLGRTVGSPISESLALLGLGRAAAAAGRGDEARRLLESSLEISRQIGHQFGIAYELAELGTVARDSGDLAAAARCYEESLHVSADMGEKWGVARALIGLGTVAAARGDVGVAEERLREAVANATAAHAPAVVTEAVFHLAELAAMRGREAEALELLALVVREPAAEARTRDRARALLAGLSERVPSPTGTATCGATTRSLGEVVNELLTSSTPRPNVADQPC